MFWPVLNGTLTTLSAFLPFLFWNSIAGKYMSWLPLTLIFVLSSSIFVALIITPALGSVFGRKPGVDAHMLAEIEKSERGDPRQMTGFMGWYARTLSAATVRPFLVTAIALGVIFAVVAWFALSQHRTEFFLKEDPDHVTVYVQARGQPVGRGPRTSSCAPSRPGCRASAAWRPPMFGWAGPIRWAPAGRPTTPSAASWCSSSTTRA